MSNYIIHGSDGKILRTGQCPETMVHIQAGPGESVLRGRANDMTDNVAGVGQFRWIRKKTPDEVVTDNPPPPVIADEDKPATMTKKEVALLMKRVEDLEDRASGE